MKQSLGSLSNDYCPQALFLYGTYKDDGTPNFGLFCWFSYCFDGELGVMACIGGEKLTKDIIRKKRVFSANLVTEELLPLADYFGNHEGYEADKMRVEFSVEKGAVLEVPILEKSPWVYELEVQQEIKLDDGDVFLCRIRNILAEETLIENRRHPLPLELAKPVITCKQTYFSVGQPLGNWEDWKDRAKL